MQTNFTAAQLRDPDIAVSNEALRTCVHCGFCTATCPTFLLLGDELDSPRGRIYLIKDMLESGQPATEQVARHVDRCLSCLSCMTTCPSGVNYMHLVDHARTHIERTYRRPWHDWLLREALAKVLPHPGRFRAALLAARASRPLAKWIPEQHALGKRLRAMLALAPSRLPAGREKPDVDAARLNRSLAGLISVGHALGDRLRAMLALAPSRLPTGREKSGVHAAQGTRRARVVLLAGCAQPVLAPEINAATIRLLTRLGVEVIVPDGAGCCGALTHHMGKHDKATASARANIEAWSLEIDIGGLDAIIINASGCGTTVKDYGFMFRTAVPGLRTRAEKVATLARDITEFLTDLGYAPTRPAPDLTVAYHSACSLQHGQQVTTAPKTLLARAGFRVVEPAEPHICCGSAGTYNMLQPELADRLRDRKLDNLRATKPDIVAAGNIGCLTQLAGGGLPVVHTVELLDWMAGGPPPAALAEAGERKSETPKVAQPAGS